MTFDESHYPPGFSLRDLVGYGKSGLVVLDESSNTVIKTPLLHPGILSYHGVVENGIRLQCAANQHLKSFNGDAGNAPITARRLRWVRKIAKALRFIRSTGVARGDLSAANVFKPLEASLCNRGVP
ncbi:hypothetical protein ACLOAV_009279 [Pseudogymnoascus australis]